MASLRETLVRLGFFILYIIYFVCSYKGIQFFTQEYVSNISLALPFEANIPFVPISFYIYILAFPFPALLAFITDLETLKKILMTFVMASLLHYAIFLLFPVSYSLRPVIPENTSSMTLWFIHLFYKLDSPLNSFPSIHVSFVYMTYYFLKKYKPALATFGHIMAYLIAISTILVKQHYILDVFAGLTVAYCFNQLVILQKFSTQSIHQRLSGNNFLSRILMTITTKFSDN